MHVQLQILPKPWKFYTILYGEDGDILQVCWKNTLIKKNPFFLHLLVKITWFFLKFECSFKKTTDKGSTRHT